MAQVFINGTKLIFLTAVTDTDIDDIEGVGTLRQEGDKFYRYVKNADLATLVVGQPVCYTLADDEQLHEAVDTPATANLAFLGGIAVSAIKTLEHGWILIEGWYDNALAANSASSVTFAAGDILRAVNASSALIHSKVAADLSKNADHGYIVAMQSRASGSTVAVTGTAGTVDAWVHCRNV